MTLEHEPSQPALPRFSNLLPTTSSTFSDAPAPLRVRPSLSNTSRQRTNGMLTKTMNRINNAICCVIVAATFTMIGIEAANQPGMTHSGTQEVHR